MNIEHVTFSDSGGAGQVAATLSLAQAQLGHDSRLLNLISGDLYSKPLVHPLITISAALDKWVVSSDSKPTLISLFRGKIGALPRTKIRADSIIHLHWTSGVIDHKLINQFLSEGRKVVWTLHDMRPFTGACHHAFDCEGYASNCESCPQVKGMFRKSVSLSLTETRRLSRNLSNLALVSPSKWMAERVSRSSRFGSQKSMIISNPIDNVYFENYSRSNARRQLGLDDLSKVAVVIASNLGDPNKNVALIIETLEKAAIHSSKTPVLLMVGKNGQQFKSEIIQVISVGVKTSESLAQMLVASDFVVSASSAESAGMTIAECGALGIPSIVLGIGAITEMLDHGVSGLVASSELEFQKNLSEALLDKFDLQLYGQAAKIKSDQNRPDNVAKKYLELYNSLK
jgi:glycosyltransferase involved in cell wall biosynthesis